MISIKHLKKMEHSNIQWIKDWSPLPQHGQHLGKFYVTLLLLNSCVNEFWFIIVTSFNILFCSIIRPIQYTLKTSLNFLIYFFFLDFSIPSKRVFSPRIFMHRRNIFNKIFNDTIRINSFIEALSSFFSHRNQQSWKYKGLKRKGISTNNRIPFKVTFTW